VIMGSCGRWPQGNPYLIRIESQLLGQIHINILEIDINLFFKARVFDDFSQIDAQSQKALIGDLVRDHE